MRNLGRQFVAKAKNRSVKTLGGTAEKPQGRFFDATPYQHHVPAYTRHQNMLHEVKKSMPPPKEMSGESVFKSWHPRHEPYVTRQKTLFNPAQFGRDEPDDRDLRTRQQLFKPRWGD